MLRFFRASRSIQVGTPEVRARSPFSRGRALARSPIGRMRHPVYTKSRLSAAAESLLFGICIRKRYSISLKRPSGPRRFCAVQVFWPKAKTLMPGQFICPEQMRSPGSPHGASRVGRPMPPKMPRRCSVILLSPCTRHTSPRSGAGPGGCAACASGRCPAGRTGG